MPDMNQTRNSYSAKDILEYHSALTLLENTLLDVRPKSSLEDIFQNYERTIAIHNPDIKAKINDLVASFVKRIKKDKADDLRLSNDEYANRFVIITRNERKKYDKSYFSYLLKGDVCDIDTAKSFMETIKEEDSSYYYTALSKLLSCFQEMPQHLQLDKLDYNRYKIDSEQKQKLDDAQEKLNSIIDDYKIICTETSENNYALRRFRRFLFDGCINQVKIKDKELCLYALPTRQQAMEISPTPSCKCMKMIEEEYKISDKNAQNLIKIFNHVMAKYSLEQQPFPILINRVCEDLQPGQNKIPFQIEMRDCYNKPVLDNYKCHKYYSNPIWRNYCQRENLGNYHKKDYTPLNIEPMEQSVKFKHKYSVLRNNEYKKAICDMVEEYLVSFCEENQLNSDIVKAAFGFKKTDTSGHPLDNYYDNLYNYLFTQQLRDKNKVPCGSMFHTEIHHDRERIALSRDANNNRQNFIITIIPNDYGIQAIYEHLLSTVVTLAHADENAFFKEAMQTYLSKRHTLPQVNIHDEILHGADMELIYEKGASKKVLHYLCSPLNPREKDENSQDNYIVAMIDANSCVLDKTKSQHNTISLQQNLNAIAKFMKIR